MAGLIQCENCGALLTKEDIFCGECGAPRPVEGSVSEPVSAESPAYPPPPQPQPQRALPAPSAESANTGWQVAFFVLIALGILGCIAGLAAFALFGSVGGDTTTPQEDWLFSTLCCLLPIGGTGALLALAGAIIWYTRLRDR